MKPTTTLGLFAGVLALVLAVGYGIGQLTGSGARSSSQHSGHGATSSAESEHGGHANEPDEADVRPGGLSASQDGLTLRPATTTRPPGTSDFRFTIIGADGKPLTSYTKSHDKELHLIVVRKDLTGFQHIHPTRDAKGTWSIPLTLAAAGPYKVYADFVPLDQDRAVILATDLTVPGSYDPQPLPAPATSATAGDYGISLSGELKPREASELELTLTKEGKQVTDLQPYLGAYGHLVTLREGDLAYLHVHPEEGPAGPTLTFVAEVPSASTYRLFLDFRHEGVVRTAALTAKAT